MNAYTDYILTVGSLEATILSTVGTEKHLDWLIYAVDEKTHANIQRLRIEATKHVLQVSANRKADLTNIENIHNSFVTLLENSIEKVSQSLH